MRIIAGTARGRRLKGPKGPGLRPTSDQVREALFNILGPRVHGARVLDLCAGTGALSFEALSRGALHATLVDKGREALSLCRDNADLLGCRDRVDILPFSVDARLSQRLCQHIDQRAGEHSAQNAEPGRPAFDLAFADPPYAAITPAQILAWLSPSLLTADATLVIEHDRRVEAPASAPGFERFDARRFGDTALAFYGRAHTD
ncbi:MAG: 16S rRNA (guanine(966)-N(2))-methyltransferase RsmD [Myxococcaceae bacterium]|nr:16S rRNA (guanine(966)-N(2))-methyltransferase RsmD [Myxococcaceae bacterium]